MQNAGKQCAAMSLAAVINSHYKKTDSWDSLFLNSILYAGNNLYSFISNFVNKTYLLLTDLPEVVSILNGTYFLEYSDPLAGDVFLDNNNIPYYSLENTLNNLFLHYEHCLLTIDCNTVAVFKTSEGEFKIFDSHSRDLFGMPHPFGKCVLVSVNSLSHLVIYFQSTVHQIDSTPFEVKGVSVKEIQAEVLVSEQPSKTNTARSHNVTPKERMKKKRLNETETEKHLRLENARKYKKAKLAVESENEKIIRREKDRLYQKNKRSNQTETQVASSTSIRNAKDNQRMMRQKQNTTTQPCSSSRTMNQVNYLQEFNTSNGFLHEQCWAKSNLNKFHKSNQFVITQCTICHEAWPLKCKPKSPNNYVCSRCYRDKKHPRKFSIENSLIPSTVPLELKNLSQVEEMLIARALPIMRVYIKPGGQRGYAGHCINLPQNVRELATSLRRYPKDLTLIIVKVKGKDNTFKDLTVRKQKVHDALVWLIRNNPHYSVLTINEQALNLLPDNGVLPDLTIVETDDDIVSDDNINNAAPTDNPEDIIYNDSTEISSFLPVGDQHQQEIEAVRNQLSGNEPLSWPSVDNEPLNEYQVSHLATMAFPTLFPDGKGDPTNPGLVRDVPFQERIKHLLKFGEIIDGKWVYRFANHPRFSYWALNMIQRKRILQQSGIFLKQNPSESHLTIDELREMAASNSANVFLSKISRYVGNIAGSNAYWNRVRDELKAIITSVGAPTLFFTFSSADMHWPELHALFNATTDCEIANSSSEVRRQNVIKNPHVVDWFFTQRLESFVKHWLYQTLGAKWHWFRYEYQGRGSIHCHGTAKLKNDPGLCQLRQL